LSLFSEDQVLRNHRFVRWQDKHLHLFGRLLLLNGIKNLGFDTKLINEIKYTLNQKPFIEGVQVDFNITHSGNYVLCAD
jgi:4'-phosphopantetheinyl transferase